MTTSAKKLAQHWLARGQEVVTFLRPEHRARLRDEERVEERLAEIAREFGLRAENPSSRTLVDGMWFNPNYWYRFTLMRAAFGCKRGHEIGLLGEYSSGRSAKAMRKLGIDDLVSFPDLVRQAKSDAAGLADAALRETQTAADVLRWNLPSGYPADFVYDGILKRQRAACVDTGATDFRGLAIEAFANALAAGRLIERQSPDLVFLSHALNFSYGAIAWAAMRRKIPTFVLLGNYGVPRFFRISEPADLYDWNDGLSRDEIDSLAPARAEGLKALGADYLARRMSGGTGDIGGQFAFQRADGRVSPEGVRHHFGWSDDKPVIAVYAHNWFDFPHGCGLSQFRDFLDWIEATIAVAKETTQFNWLLKAHPCDEWYGGVTLRDLMPALPPHMGLVPTAWNGADLQNAADALVTVQSTGGLEVACQGKPVLLADSGWYDKAGFAVVSTSRADYLARLKTEWWHALDLGRARERALVFAGAYFCSPDWQSELLMADDSQQDALWTDIDRLLDNRDGLVREVASVSDWIKSGEKRFHSFKMLEDRSKLSSNFVASRAAE